MGTRVPAERWTVVFHPDFEPEFAELERAVKSRLGAMLDLLREDGPSLHRPHADTLKGSKHRNMKELRLATADDWYRFAFVFDPKQRALILCGGGKGGMSQEKFYKALIARADRRFDAWLREMNR